MIVAFGAMPLYFRSGLLRPFPAGMPVDVVPCPTASRVASGAPPESASSICIPRVHRAPSIGVVRVVGARIVRKVEDPGNARGAVVIAEVVALPVDAAIQERDDDALAGHAQRGDGLVDTRFRANAVDGECAISGTNGQDDCRDSQRQDGKPAGHAS